MGWVERGEGRKWEGGGVVVKGFLLRSNFDTRLFWELV